MVFPIYFDYAATTPVDPRVLDKMLPFLTMDGCYANPASSHALGGMAKKAVDEARQQVAVLLNAEPSEIIWTSGATEANNLALKGVAALYQQKGKHIVTLKTEHPSVLDTCQQLEKQGFHVSYLIPHADGRLDIDQFKASLRPDTILVSMMHVNNEIGVIHDLQKIAEITSEQGILLHTDAAQSAGKIALDVSRMPIDLISLSAHKIYGPKGIGALYIRRKPRVRVAAMMHGGGQEQGMRSGTLPVHQIVGMGAAFALASECMSKDYEHMQQLRARFLQQLQNLPQATLNGDPEHSYPGIVNVGFAGINALAFSKKIPDIALSIGSACHSKGIEASSVLRAMGLTELAARSSMRFSFGRPTRLEDIDFAIQIIREAIANV